MAGSMGSSLPSHFPYGPDPCVDDPPAPVVTRVVMLVEPGSIMVVNVRPGQFGPVVIDPSADIAETHEYDELCLCQECSERADAESA